MNAIPPALQALLRWPERSGQAMPVTTAPFTTAP